MVGYPLAYAKDDAVVRPTNVQPQRNRDGSPPVPPVQSTVAQPVRNTPHGHLKDTKTAADLRRTIIQGIESWFITGDTNDPTAASTKSVGFKSLGYIPEDWTSMQEGSIERRTAKKDLYRQAMDERTYRVLLTHGNALERSVRSGTCPDEDVPTTPALAYDKRLNNELNSIRVRSAHVSSRQKNSKCH
jgi:hypothetical protein